MASLFAFSTPSPPGPIHTPTTPKHGYIDNWEPYSPRKSARISEKRANARTPSPRSFPSAARPSTRTAQRTTTAASSFSTPATSPRKKRMPAMDSVRRASDALTAEDTANAADSLGINLRSHKKPQGAVASSHSIGMLPTPAKTPRKQSDAETEAATRAIARNLFSTDTGLESASKKKPKKYTGLTLESFTAEDMEDPIEIFTDSRDRIPEVDMTADNPFYGGHSAAPTEEPPKRRSKRRQVVIPGEGKQAIEEAVKREDGIVYVFRGKKIFRKFSQSHDANSTSQPDYEDEAAEEEGEGSSQPRRSGRITRSSIKPRLLFPPAKKGKNVAKPTTDEEEAATDIEDHVLVHTEVHESEGPETPVKAAGQKASTPDAPRFAPASPPTTARATRTAKKLQDEDSPMRKPAKPRSPFDGWRRSKSRAGPQGQKREGESLSRGEATTKRPRA
ncbi:hypothetical protein GGR56DRAFT_411905 [Xylariaceae sp. FL0804]|nr:hypothetical protein GGR56DRAFT_411905 [Xylariaceae sp. FL0804]